MKWTSELPKENGYFWFRGNPDEPAEDWCVFQIWEEGGVFFMSYNDRAVSAMASRWPRCQWAGPIPEPQET